MSTMMEDGEAQNQDHETQPLLDPELSDDGNDGMTPIQRAIGLTFKCTAHLSNLLPTGTVLAFQILSPIFTNQGNCDIAERYLTACLVGLCGLSCIILSFTDSFRDGSGTVRYGMATFKGLWNIDGTTPLPPEIAANYKLRFIDFFHAFMSVLVFAAVALLDKNVVSCFYPILSEETMQVLMALPVAIGVIGSMLFVTFPTTRHGVGFPLSPH